MFLPSTECVLAQSIECGMLSYHGGRLCYIDVFDWSKLTSVRKEDHFIMQNRDVSERINICPKYANGYAMCAPQVTSLGAMLLTEECKCGGKIEMSANAVISAPSIPMVTRCAHHWKSESPKFWNQVNAVTLLEYE